MVLSFLVATAESKTISCVFSSARKVTHHQPHPSTDLLVGFMLVLFYCCVFTGYTILLYVFPLSYFRFIVGKEMC